MPVPPPRTPRRAPLGRRLAADDHSRERARGALLGLAVGDALGTTNEFRKLMGDPFPLRMKGPHVDVVGGGPFKVKRGQVTDDTQMACCLADSLRERRAFDREDLARRYVAWMDHAFDIGALTRASLEDIEAHRFAPIAGKRRWIESGKSAAGNGSLMRTAPIGVFFAFEDVARVEASLLESAITHFDPRCQLACAAFNGAIACCIGGPGELDAREILEAARSELARAATLLARLEPEFIREIQDAAAALRADLQFAEKKDPELYGPELHLLRQQGFVRVAFRLAFWELVHAESYEDALLDVVNRGGDADTNGAITGALLGAAHGHRAIPAHWSEVVLDSLPGDHGPLGTAYHPRQLVVLTPR